MSQETKTKNDQQHDPVCDMKVTRNSEYQFMYGEKQYFFCSEHCFHKFKEQPERFLSKKEPPIAAPGAEANTYTCPMHPEVQQLGPGSCPKCGMALEPSTVQVEEKNEELIDMTRRCWISGILAFPVFLLAMTVDMQPDLLPRGLSQQAVQWLEFALATPVVLWGGWPFLVRGWASVKSWNLNMFTLISMGVSVAWIYSVIALLVPEIFPLSMQMGNGLVHVYFEAAAVIVTLVLLGQVLELRARSRTNAAIQLLLSLAPNTARIVRSDGKEEDIPLEQVQPGDTL